MQTTSKNSLLPNPTLYYISVPQLSFSSRAYSSLTYSPTATDKFLRLINVAFEIYEKTPTGKVFIHRPVNGILVRKPKKRRIPSNWLAFSSLDEAISTKVTFLNELRETLRYHVLHANKAFEAMEPNKEVQVYLDNNPELFL